MANTTGRLMNSKGVQSIMKKRITVSAQHIGKTVVLMLQGNGNIIDVKTKEGEFVASAADTTLALQKKIFNVRANSAIAMANPINQQKLKDGMKAAKLGWNFNDKGEPTTVKDHAKAEQASELFNDYLNSVQISFGILLPNAKIDKFFDAVEIAGRIEKVTTDNGSLLTVDASTIRVKEPDVITETTSFDLSAFLDGDDDDAGDEGSATGTEGGDAGTGEGAEKPATEEVPANAEVPAGTEA